MAVIRLNHFEASVGNEDALFEGLRAVVPLISNSKGCLACRIVREQGAPEKILIIEEWDSEAAHKTSLAGIPPETFQPVMALLAGPPSGAYYSA